MKKALSLALLLSCLFLPSEAQAERDIVDKIVAVVGEQVILASEVASQMQIMAMQTGNQPKTDEEAKEFRDQVIDQMINDRLFLVAAQNDTAISVRPEDVDRALDERITQVSENFGSHQAFLDALQREGMTLRDLRKRFRLEVENQLLKQRLIQTKLYSVSVSKKEVEEFYEKFSDSIPAQPEAVRLAHILLSVKPSERVEDSVKAFAEQLRDSIMAGADFGDISMKYSSFGAGANGGDLGFVSREDLVEEFARSAFNLRTGDVSGIVRTQFGYHIIRAEGRRGEQMRLRHVLLGVQPAAADSQKLGVLVDSLVNAANAGESFEKMAKTYSEDDDTRAQGGELGWFATDQMPAEFAEGVANWKTPGEARGPVISRFGYHILKLLEYQESKKYSLTDDFDQVKELARQDKTGKFVDNWIQEIKDETHIDIRDVD